MGHSLVSFLKTFKVSEIKKDSTKKGSFTNF